MKNNKGFTLLEVIVSLAVICVVSVSTVIVVNSSSRAKKYDNDCFDAVNIAENLFECFKAASDNTEFEALARQYITALSIDFSNGVASQGDIILNFSSDFVNHGFTAKGIISEKTVFEISYGGD